MVVLIDGADLLMGADFREFFLFFFLLLLLLAGIGALETSSVNFVDLQHGFHHAQGANAIREEGSDFRHGYSRAEEIISGPTGHVCCDLRGKVNTPTANVATRVGHPRVFFSLTVLGSVSKS